MFFVPEPETFEASRVDLTFGLRSAIRYHREQTVPSIGGLWFVRQATWALAGIHLFRSNPEIQRVAGSPAVVANAIEALACKMEYKQDPKNFIYRGRNAFSRDAGSDIWSFSQLRNKSHYVQITYRQNAVSALPDHIGLGFTSNDTIRFNQMVLTDSGFQIANYFFEQKGAGRGSQRLGNFLTNWILGSDLEKTVASDGLRNLINPQLATQFESQKFHERLTSQLNPKAGITDVERRIRLAKIMPKLERSSPKNRHNALDQALRGQGGAEHALQIQNAMRFEAMLKKAIDLLAVCAKAMKTQDSGLKVHDLAGHTPIREAFKELQDTCRAYHEQGNELHKVLLPETSQAFIEEMQQPIEKALISLIRRDGRILQVLDDRIAKASLFNDDFGTTKSEDASLENTIQETSGWSLARLNQWQALWDECGGNK